MVDERGQPCLIDPAVHGGHREIDLAMMRLFGGFGPRVFAAYDEAFPLPPGHEERVPLYQLYFLMVHVNLFGGSYVASVESALARILLMGTLGGCPYPPATLRCRQSRQAPHAFDPLSSKSRYGSG